MQGEKKGQCEMQNQRGIVRRGKTSRQQSQQGRLWLSEEELVIGKTAYSLQSCILNKLKNS